MCHYSSGQTLRKKGPFLINFKKCCFSTAKSFVCAANAEFVTPGIPNEYEEPMSQNRVYASSKLGVVSIPQKGRKQIATFTLLP